MKMAVFVNEDFLSDVKNLMEKEVPVKASYKLSKIYQKLGEEQERFNQLRRDIIIKHAQKDKKGEVKTDENGSVQIKKNEMDKMNEELQELANIDIEVETITIDELGDKIDVSPRLLTNLSDIIVD